MINLLIQVFYVLAVLAVISLFVCTLPIWLVVLVVVLLRPCKRCGGTPKFIENNIDMP